MQKDRLRAEMAARHTLMKLRDRRGFEASLDFETFVNIAACDFQMASLPDAFVLMELAFIHEPITVRGLMYRAVALGLYPSTSNTYYSKTGRVILKLRRAGILPFEWIIDTTRRSLKPQTWSGLGEFLRAVAHSYRLNHWQRQREHVEIFSEKDAMAGFLEPVTNKLDVRLNIIRGEVSETRVWEIAQEWKQIRKPIFAYYLGDHDPHGLQIEASIRRKLYEFAERDFQWERLAITSKDFDNDALLGIPVKRGEGKKGIWQPYLDEFGDRCVEVDAIEPDEIRRRVSAAIARHIDKVEWEAAKRLERRQQSKLRKFIGRSR